MTRMLAWFIRCVHEGMKYVSNLNVQSRIRSGNVNIYIYLTINVLKIDENRCKKNRNKIIRVMGAAGNREYTVFSTKYWTLRSLTIIMLESHSLPPGCIMYSITGRHFYFIMLKSSCIMKQNLHVKIESERIISANKRV